MNIQTIMNCGLIFVGAIILLVSIVRVRRLMRTIPSSPEPHRKQTRLFLVIHRELMSFFFIGYIAVMVAFAFRYSLVSEVLLSLIFLCGLYLLILEQSCNHGFWQKHKTPCKALFPSAPNARRFWLKVKVLNILKIGKRLKPTFRKEPKCPSLMDIARSVLTRK
ncbi:MAG: hypothetical protein MAG551_02257 [Candidatus Scalindua arabica]|uniref:Uncharacterized protein n=1 Tax=Candidatus Scalindua arabica TaxID=1127984 RepID=A0A941W494_9BACT|nr:hypothetical protein [Candidatus Scalindua arabica]